MGFDGLYGLVRGELAADPRSGDLFLFVNARRISAKVLLWDGTGLCIYAKRPAKATFSVPWLPREDQPLGMTTSELSLFLEGARLSPIQTPSSP